MAPKSCFASVVVAVLLTVPGTCSAVTASVAANPIRRVVSMLQAMQTKVEEEGKKESDTFDKYMCFCQDGQTSFEKSIAEAEAKIPQTESNIKELEAEKAQLTSDVAQHKQDRADATASLEEATALRKQQAADYAKESTDAKANLAALAKAIDALENGVSEGPSAGSFLQSRSAVVLRRLTAVAELSDADRNSLAAFLSGTQDDGYAPQSGEIIGILKQLDDTMTDDLEAATKQEKSAQAEYDSMSLAKNREIEALTKMIEDKTARLGEAGVELANAEEDLVDETASLANDKKFLAELVAGCDKAKADWGERSKARSEELLVLSDTIKMLNDDDALDLFKKTLPSPSFLQVAASSKDRKQRARRLLQVAAQKGDERLGLLSMTLRGKRANFDKVLKMCDDMIDLLGKEQQADDDKKAYCVKEFDAAEDQQKKFELDISDLDKVIGASTSALSTLTEEMAALTAGIQKLDKDVAKATELRKEQHAAYAEELASNNAAKELLGMAKTRLNKFYSPKVAMVEKEMGHGELQHYESEGTAFVQAAASMQLPKYDKKSDANSGVIALLDMLVGDLSKEMQLAQTEENDSQANYEKYMTDSGAKRTADAKILAEKAGQKAEAEATLNKNDQTKKETVAKATALAEYTASLHKSCDWLLANHDVRKQARASEVESLNQAKAILSGADYSFLQTSALPSRPSPHSRLAAVGRVHFRGGRTAASD